MEPMPPEMPVIPHGEMLQHQDFNKKIFMALMAASAVLCSILVLISCFWISRRKISRKFRSIRFQNSCNQFPNVVAHQKLSQLKSSLDKCSANSMEFGTLNAATNNFHDRNVLHGRVYRACFSDKRMAAVKRMEGREKEAEFENEVSWLTKIQHKNIISLLGYCINGEAMYLIYEMMDNGSLENQLHGQSRGSSLSWNLRIKLAVDVAKGLEYLHEHCNPPVVHSNVKSSNILLDSKFNAKLSHFNQAVTACARNKKIKHSETTGYAAPESLLEGKLSDKSDVYAFGVVLLELLTGRRSVVDYEEQSESLVKWAMPHLNNRSKLSTIVDPLILSTMDLKHLYQVAAVAVLCVQNEPSYRPLITDVLHSLIPLLPLELGGSLRVTEPAR